MSKIALKILGIICGNLFAFLGIGHILDAIFKTGTLWTLLCLGLSIPVLGIILWLYTKDTLHQLGNVSTHESGKSQSDDAN